MPSTKRAVIYARVATLSQQADSHTSLHKQVERGLEYARQRGYEVVDTIKEVASGFSLERNGLTALQDAAKQGQYAVLIVSSFDRLSRSHVQVATFFHALQAYDVNIESIHAPDESISFNTSIWDIFLRSQGKSRMICYKEDTTAKNQATTSQILNRRSRKNE